MALGTKRKASNILSKQPLDLPPGTIHAFAGTTAPEKWAMCDGSEVSKTQYAALYAVIGDIYGTPVDSNNFVLPDLRGEFLRGLDNMGTAAGARGKDVDGTARTVGQTQTDATAVNGLSAVQQQHRHLDTNLYSGTRDYGSGTNTVTYGNGTALNVFTDYQTPQITVNSGDTETRPANIAINYIIKL